jgi:putative ABC transport system permease protein
MLRNFFVIAWRSMRRQRGYTLLNIVGLTTGISASLLILMYVTQQLSFDVQHLKRDRIVRISSDISEPDDSFRWSVSQGPLGPELARRFPEVEATVRVNDNGQVQIKRDDQTFLEEKAFTVDSSVFQVFTFDLLAGDALTALRDPNSVALARSVAARVFGTDDVASTLGRTLTIGESEQVKVTAIYEDMPSTSHLIMRIMRPIEDPEGRMERPGAWGGFFLYTYALLQPGTTPEAFAAKLPAVITEFVVPIFEQYGVTVKYEVIRLADIHLESTFQGEPKPTGSKEYLYIFGAIGIFLLLLACINYMNLATARSQHRAREVGVRKTMGAYRGHLVGQFLAESLFQALLALTLSLGVVYLSLPFFNHMLDLPLTFRSLWQWQVLLGMLGILTVTGLAAGSYPAFYLSSFHPADVLKGTTGKTTGGNRLLRQALVVVQFSISLFMLVSTGVVYDQLRYLDDKDLGFTQSPVIQFSIANAADLEKWPVLRQKLLAISGVEAAATTGSVPGQGYGKNLTPVETNEGEMVERGVDLYPVDYDYFPTMEMQVIAGRNFDRGRGLDSTHAVMVNEAMVQRMAWTEPIGKKVTLNFGGDTPTEAQVIGVVRDFHQQSLYEEISALMFLRGDQNRMQVLRIEGAKVDQTLAQVEAAWKSVFPTTPFVYEFQDEAFMEQYQAEAHRSQLFMLFSILTILIACLGLLGLASFTAEQRTRELGIRKIVGASVPQLVRLLTQEFVLLVLLATPLGFVAAWWFMRDWLTEFAYHTELSGATFALALVATLAITLMTTSYHAYRAATINPAQALRQE